MVKANSLVDLRQMRIAATEPEQVSPGSALASCRGAFIGVALMSGVINLLYLTGSFFMLEVYDRVLPSRSVPTLIALGVIAFVLYAFQGALDLIRGRIFVRIGTMLDNSLVSRIYDASIHLSVSQRKVDPLQPSRDLDQVRQFLGSGGPVAFLDLPWIPVYLLICFVFHFWIGIAAVVGALILIALTLLTEHGTKEATRTATANATRRWHAGEASRRNAEVIQALGMADQLGGQWQKANSDYLTANSRISDVVLGLSSLSKMFRTALQSFVLALGAWLVIHQEATGGIMIASSILVARALAPVEMAIGQWKGFVSARLAWRRLGEVLATMPKQQQMRLPAPTRTLSLEGVTLVPPGAANANVWEVSLSLAAGDALGVVGNSASGKSSLARALVGVWPPARGPVRLDGASLDQWSPQRLGPHIGYMPQDVELFAGSVAENIARFEPGFKPEAVIAAARAADIHELIVKLPGGYDMQIGEQGNALSAGQKQRVALARALYRNPFLVVLDEPNSNLDAEGDEALTQAILGVRARGGIVVIVAHRPTAIAGCNLLMMMAGGRCQMVGGKDEVLAAITRPAAARQVGERARG
jgi:PrtD family type I secretion system ABC transporter